MPPHSRLTPPVRRVPPTDEHLSLLELVQLAERVGGSNHGFTYIQLPVSAGMPEAWSQTWQMVERSGSGGVAAERVTLLQAAQQVGGDVHEGGIDRQGCRSAEAAKLQLPLQAPLHTCKCSASC